MTKTILVVETDNLTRHLIVDTLRKAGYCVCAAPDGYYAIEALVAQPPDLVLCDATAPSPGHFCFLACICSRAALSQIPVIMVGDCTRCKVCRFGADAYIAAPFSASMLLAAVKRRLCAKAA
ncbi:MAG: response regulator [Anaerolineae bacterium]|nr:response regulator [Anaerolineae bacterium]